MKTYTIELEEADARLLERLAYIEEVEISDVIARALVSEDFLFKEHLKGAKIILEYPDGSFRETRRVMSEAEETT